MQVFEAGGLNVSRTAAAEHAARGARYGSASRATSQRTGGELNRVKKRTWEIFSRWLMIGGALFALLLLAVLTFVYSRY